jgi:non-ribosomal peptide synthetase component E (peptide arylation enzyme)
VHAGRLCYAFEGRAKENIDRGGEKFGGVAIEEFMAEHPAVAEACVVGMPDPELGERVCAFVVLQTDAPPPTVEEMAAFLAARGLASFKTPERIQVVEVFPVTRVGKLDRAALRRLAEGLDAGTPAVELGLSVPAAGGCG